ncbi:hypothetical protein [Paenibacillus sacheonensis]|uniref:Uncharacterized protein n=1 Tax=Paenibacillus sacheonensis TaxID=742054 RepID=A0A7X5BYK7_9BACL|nr:hypothetical protein [Paenibacillus sacheonensis]MBM7567420.1 hypothetical protein [Paenibacillus sacheonensis]NBC69797.1 hypothetical protein [Paenibacillus sacheonensis]
MSVDFNYDTDTWVQFLKDNWLFLVIALVVLLLVVRVVKTVVKWLIVVVILAGVVIYSGYSLEDVKSIGTKVADSVKQEAVAAMAGEAKDATFTNNSDGTFTVRTKNLELDGTPGKGEVKVTFHGTSLGTWKIDTAIQSLIDQAKNNV